MKRIFIIISAILSISLIAFIYFMTRDNYEIVNVPQVPENVEIIGDTQVEQIDYGVLFGISNDDKYTFVDMTTEEIVDLIPEGYEIVSQHSYDVDPEYFILKKENKAYIYSTVNESVEEIKDLTLQPAEEIFLYPSISEDAKFYMDVNTMEEVEGGGLFGAVPISVRKYFLDATEGKITKADDVALPGVKFFSGCFQYDSKYARFFIWPCGEGIGSAIPLNSYDLITKKQEEIIGLEDFGIVAGDLAELKYSNGKFISFDRATSKKVVVVDPLEKDIVKKTFSVVDDVDVLDMGYSMSYVEEKNMFVTGGSDSIGVLKHNDNNEIVDVKEFAELEPFYANFVFIDGERVYYMTRWNIKVLNLNTLNIEKVIPVDKYSEETTLISEK